jgi:pantetheine-phosphate adenylyltransferase
MSSLRRGVIAGSFDLFTRGHLDVVIQAAKLVDELHIFIAASASKKPRFSFDVRKKVLEECLEEERHQLNSTLFAWQLDDYDLLIHKADKLGATVLFRGIRNTIDFEYEKNIADVNRELCPHISTFFLTPEPNLAKVSSSLVDGIVGKSRWESIVERWVQSPVIYAYQQKLQDRLKISNAVAQ